MSAQVHSTVRGFQVKCQRKEERVPYANKLEKICMLPHLLQIHKRKQLEHYQTQQLSDEFQQ